MQVAEPTIIPTVVPPTPTFLPTPTVETVKSEPESIVVESEAPVDEAATGQELTKPRMVMFWSAY